MNKIEREINNLDENEAKGMVLRLIDITYTYVEWPESQNYMEKKWFKKEAILDVEGEIGSSYLIPTRRIYEKI